MFITFDGIDGCGKNTQLNMVADFFTGIDKNCKILDFWGYDRFKDIIKGINNNKVEVSAIAR